MAVAIVAPPPRLVVDLEIVEPPIAIQSAARSRRSAPDSGTWAGRPETGRGRGSSLAPEG